MTKLPECSPCARVSKLTRRSFRRGRQPPPPGGGRLRRAAFDPTFGPMRQPPPYQRPPTSKRQIAATLARRLAWHHAVHDPVAEPRNRGRWLPELRRWQAERLARSFEGFMDHPGRRPAAEFFLSDLYGDRDFSQRDADIARVVPKMQRLLPQGLLETLADAIELGALSHAFDLRMAEWLQANAGSRRKLDDALYAEAYRAVGRPRLRSHQIDLIVRAGYGLGMALKTRGVSTLLAVLRGPARAAGLGELQSFLERGFGAYAKLDDVAAFVHDIEAHERAVSRNLLAGRPRPFDVARGAAAR